MAATIVELWSANDEERMLAVARAAAVDDLFGGLLSVANATPDERREAKARLREWSTGLAQRMDGSDPRSQANALVQLLGVELGFRASGEHQEDLSNTRLPDVLKSRLGHPAVVGAIWFEVARSAGIGVRMLVAPGWTLLDVGEALIDIAEGALADPTALRDEDGAMLQPQPVEVSDVVARVLRYVVHHHALHRDLVGMFQAVSMVGAVRPDATIFMQRATLAEQLGARSLAEETWMSLGRSFPESREAHLAMHKLAEHGGPVVLN